MIIEAKQRLQRQLLLDVFAFISNYASAKEEVLSQFDFFVKRWFYVFSTRKGRVRKDKSKKVEEEEVEEAKAETNNTMGVENEEEVYISDKEDTGQYFSDVWEC